MSDSDSEQLINKYQEEQRKSTNIETKLYKSVTYVPNLSKSLMKSNCYNKKGIHSFTH